MLSWYASQFHLSAHLHNVDNFCNVFSLPSIIELVLYYFICIYINNPLPWNIYFQTQYTESVIRALLNVIERNVFTAQNKTNYIVNPVLAFSIVSMLICNQWLESGDNTYI